MFILKSLKKFDSAMRFAQSAKPKPGYTIRIFAFQVDYFGSGKMNDKDWAKINDEVPDPSVAAVMHPNFATLHQLGQDPSTWCREWMNHNIVAAGAKVRHKPFVPEEANRGVYPTQYKYLMFCVVGARKQSYLPAAVTYGG
jgi:hypothetical protein